MESYLDILLYTIPALCAFSSFEIHSYFISFQGSLNFGESDLKWIFVARTVHVKIRTNLRYERNIKIMVDIH